MREVIETLNLHYCTVRTVLLKTLGAESLIELDSAPHIFESRLTEYCHVLDDYRYCTRYRYLVPKTPTATLRFARIYDYVQMVLNVLHLLYSIRNPSTGKNETKTKTIRECAGSRFFCYLLMNYEEEATMVAALGLHTSPFL